MLAARLWNEMLLACLLCVAAQHREARAIDSAVDVALGATRYRLDHGDYPAAVSSLVPRHLAAFPVDPFDGQPLRFKKNSDGSVVIYSVGPDMVDNGGQVDPTQGAKDVPDIGIILKLPPGR